MQQLYAFERYLISFEADLHHHQEKLRLFEEHLRAREHRIYSHQVDIFRKRKVRTSAFRERRRQRIERDPGYLSHRWGDPSQLLKEGARKE